MILAALALAVECDPAAAIDAVRAAGQKEAYLCVVESDQGAPLAAEAIAATGDEEPRLRRAVALWLLQRYDAPFDPSLVVLLNAGDKRLLADGIKARRGRRSPVPEHDAVFSQFDWYKPLAGYTDGRLRDVDLANLQAINRPPPPAAVVVAEPSRLPLGMGALEAAIVVAVLGLSAVGVFLWRRPR